MRALAPSSMASDTATRLRASGVTAEVILTEYLPRDRYWRRISCSARSSTERSKMRASASPAWRMAFFSASASNSREPLTSTEAMAGRSSTRTTSTSPSRASCTSLKKPVA